MKLTDNFSLSELVHPDIIERIGDRAADFLHPQLPTTLQALRDKFGAITVNGTFRGKTFTDSGLRHPKSKVGAKLSSHRFGTAADLKFYEITPIEVQEYIVRHQNEFPAIRRMEDAKVTVTWLHIETTFLRKGNIYVFKP